MYSGDKDSLEERLRRLEGGMSGGGAGQQQNGGGGGATLERRVAFERSRSPSIASSTVSSLAGAEGGSGTVRKEKQADSDGAKYHDTKKK